MVRGQRELLDLLVMTDYHYHNTPDDFAVHEISTILGKAAK